MNQRGVRVIATYLATRPLGRIVRVRKVSDHDYIAAIEDVRDGRAQLIRSSEDLRRWLESFRAGECLMPAAAICGRCDRIHIDRDFDGELLTNCVRCSAELMQVGVESFLAQFSQDG